MSFASKKANIKSFNAMYEEVVGPIDVPDIEDCMQQRKHGESGTSNLIPPSPSKKLLVEGELTTKKNAHR